MWSPQRYIDEGIEKGIDQHLLDRAIAQIEQVALPHPNLPALLTLGHLARRLEENYFDLRKLVRGSRSESYRFFRIRKRSGGHRLISVPEPGLMKAQRWIAAHILNSLPIHHCSFAFKPESSIYRCAARHCRARWLVKMDVSGFFGSINEIQVYHVFRQAAYQPLVAFELARLCTHAPEGSSRYKDPTWQAPRHPSPIVDYHTSQIGFLPQGAPTSPMLSNLVMRDADAAIEAIAKAAGLRYTRYSDDLTFSTSADFDRRRAKTLINEVTRVLARKGLSPNPRKTVVVPPGSRKVVLGLLVDGGRPTLTREFRSTLRQHLYYLERLGPRAHAQARGFDSIGGMYRHVRGCIDFAKMVDKPLAAALLSRFDRIPWPLESEQVDSA